MRDKINIAVLVSGGGTNLQALIDAEKTGIITSGKITLVISNNPDAYALERAKQNGIETAVITRKECGSRRGMEKAISALLDEKKIDLIILAGFMSILGEKFTSKYPNRILNVHPALIPSFCGEGFYGLKVHEAALAKGVKVTGATVHFVNEIPDGGEIIMQKAVDVLEGDTPEVLQQRVMREAEWIILPQSTEKVAKSILEREKKMNIYEISKIGELLKGNTYPGRGIVAGLSEDGKYAVAAYFIMGRSANSRNRIFVKKNGEVFTEPFDASKVVDPSLIIYAAVRQYKNQLIVTNGNQTDTVYEGHGAGKCFAESLKAREFEPDAPNWTPRISAELDIAEPLCYRMNILKSIDAEGSACARYNYDYPAVAGLGHFIHTYVCDGNPIPTFQGEPERVAIRGGLEDFAKEVWDALDENNRISLYVRFTKLSDGSYEDKIINKNI